MEVAKQHRSLRAGDQEDDKYENQKSEHVVRLVRPANTKNF